MKYSLTGPVYIVIVAFIWAFDGVLRRSLFVLPPAEIVFYEHLIGALIIAPFLLAKFKNEKLTGREWSALVWVSLLSGVLGTLWFTTAIVKIQFISFSVVFLLQKLQPIFAIGSARLLLKERISRSYLQWAGLALVAAYFVTFANGMVNLSTGKETAIAALFAFGAAFAWGSSTAFSRYTLLKHSGTVITGLRFAITTVMAFFVMLLLQRSATVPILTVDQTARLLLIALSTGMVAMWLYYRGLKRTQTKIATILELVFPLTAVFIDVVLYHNVLAWSQYTAAVVLLFAVYKVSQLNRANEIYTSEVVSGRGKGREMGAPTLNLKIPQHFPHQHGIYAGWVIIGDARHRAAFHYGPVPVFDQTAPSLEAHILDITLSERPSVVSFQLIEYLREIKKFASERKLVEQILRDVARTRTVLTI